MVHDFIGYRLETKFIYGQVPFDTHIDVKPFMKRKYKENPKAVHNWFEGSDNWNTLGNELERVFDEKNWSSLTENFNGKFYMYPLMQVEYKVTSKSCETSGGQKEIIYGLKCVIERIEERNQFCNGKSLTKSDVEYEPENSLVAYAPYTPSKKSNDSLEEKVTPASSDLREEPYCPEPIMSVSDPLQMPQYKAKPIDSKLNDKRGMRCRVIISKQSENKTGDTTATNVGIKKRKKNATDVVSYQSRKENNGPSLRLRQPKGKRKENDTTTIRERSESKYFESAESTNDSSNPEAETPMTSSSSHHRSRSASTLSVKNRGNIRKTRNKKIKETKVTELFGSDDDDEDAAHRATTSSSAANSAKSTQSPPNSDSMIPTCNTTTSATEKQAKILEILERFMKKPSPPKKVDLLFLKDMKTADVLNTFELHENQITRVYKELKNKTENCEDYQGLSHILIMDLFEQSVEQEMIKHLEYKYNLVPNNKCLNLILNALIPTWALLIFMDKYKMTREDAMKQIREQQNYGDYLNGQIALTKLQQSLY